MKRFPHPRIIGFWGLLFFVFSLSITGLLTFIVSDQQYRQNLTSSAYTNGTTNITDINHYITKFEFYRPTATYKISSSDFARLKAMVPYTFAAADNFNKSFGTTVEPEIIVWWSYAEGINGRISFSNCNDRVYSISNCYYPASWQLGYGIQFSAIGLLEKAFSDMHGNPNDSTLVARVGQGVLNVDMANNTSPRCGGYSCSFPKMTVHQILSGVSTSHQTTNNWWASVLSRDPSINAYMNAEALQVKRFNRQLAWGWGSYYRTHWQEYSNDVQTILTNWNALGGCPAFVNCFNATPTPTPPVGGFVPPSDTPVPPTPTPTRVPTSTPTLTPTPTVVPSATPTSSPTPGPNTPTLIAAVPSDTPTPTPTEEPSPSPTPEVTEVPQQEIPSISLAPIAGITSVPQQPVSPTPQPSVLVADQRVNRTLGVVSVAGLLFVLLLAIPITRKKIFFLFRKVFFRKEENDDAVEKIYYVKTEKTENGKEEITLTDDNGSIRGVYKKGEIPEGFARIKGTMKMDSVKYIVIDSFEQVEEKESK